ncbi:MAG: nucleotide sugar dehydrogenase [Proteobacteria bacterium]|jgi:nucleotide sugar dehydrogenase|nr:nucleotide sugar dehydrogenase [Pseudomonadota bacterium]
MNYQKLLRSKKFKIAVWGTGYIGLSTMVYFSKENINCIGYDIDKEKIRKINSGVLPLKDLKTWFGFDIKKLVKQNYLKATSDFDDLNKENFLVHFIAIPTEKDGKPYYEPLLNVLDKIVKLKNVDNQFPPIIIVESTLAPKVSDNKIIPFLEKSKLEIGKDILFSVAPRRDWFIEGVKNLKNLDRVYGSTDRRSALATRDVLSIVCKKLHEASSYKVSEMVKSVENAYRHMDITLANQLSLAFPKDNMREVLKLVGTKWNLETFHPGIGTGGYCIPLSSRYILSQVKDKNKLTLLRETIKTDDNMNLILAKSIAKKRFKKIGILGLSYKGNLKVSVLSKVIPLVRSLKKNKLNVKLNDPYFTDKEIKDILDVKTFKFPNDLNKFDCIIITVDHKQFKIPEKKLKKYLKKCKFIVDHDGAWKNYNLSNNYHLSGDSNWI